VNLSAFLSIKVLAASLLCIDFSLNWGLWLKTKFPPRMAEGYLREMGISQTAVFDK